MKTALITGAAGGIGKALCERFAAAGYKVVGTDLPGSGRGLLGIDLERFAQDVALRTEALQALRLEVGPRLDVLVNNAGVQRAASTDSVTARAWQETLAVNLSAPFLLAQGLLPQLQTAAGCIINIGSIHARLTKPGFVAYATSKAALEGLTRALAVDLGGTVRVNCISPAAIRTPMLESGFESEEQLADLASVHPAGVVGEPEDVAEAALAMAEMTTYATGMVWNLDGGVASRLHDPV